MSRVFGYCRVSTTQQSLDIQVAAVEAQGVERRDIYTDKETGSTMDRVGLDRLLADGVLQKGDKILVTRLDRLGRDTLEMLTLVKQLSDIGVYISFFEDGFDTSRPQDELMITIMAAIAKSERRRILERTESGRDAAMSKGIKFGRKVSIDRGQFAALVDAGKGASAIAREMNISRSAVYKIKAELSLKCY